MNRNIILVLVGILSIFFILSACDLMESQQSYEVIFEDYDGTILKTDNVAYSQGATAPIDPLREGYTFIGWDHDFTEVIETLTIRALYEINVYEVIFENYDGTILKTDNVTHGQGATAPIDPLREGYTFIGWDHDFTEVVETLTIRALYEIKIYRVDIHDLDDSLVDSLVVTHGTILLNLSDYEDDTSVVYQWFIEGQSKPISEPFTVDSNLTILADWYSKGLDFNSYLGGYEVSLGNAAEDNIKIPAYYNSRPVLKIADYGFEGSAIFEVYIPYTVESVGVRAFQNATSLNQVHFADKSRLTSIEWDAFAQIESLKTIRIPEGLKSLGQGVFYLSGLEVIILPSTLNHIGPYALTHTWELREIIVSEDNPYFSSQDGVLYTKDFKELLVYPSNQETWSYTVHPSTHSIAGHAFDQARVSILYLPDSLSLIENYNFAGGHIQGIVFIDGVSENLTFETDTFFGARNNLTMYVDEDSLTRILTQGDLETYGFNLQFKSLEEYQGITMRAILDLVKNSWIVTGDEINEDRVRVFDSWRNVASGESVHTYFFLPHEGSLNLTFNFQSSINQTIRITFNGETRAVKLDEVNKTYEWGEISELDAGHYSIVFKLDDTYSNQPTLIETIDLQGSSLTRGLGQIPSHETQMPAALHLWPRVPESYGDIEWLYSEVLVEEGDDILYTFFMANGFAEGYFGIQTNRKNIEERWVLFSIWSPYVTDDPNEIPENQRVRLIRQGEGVTVGEFGNEGSGGQSYMPFPWVVGQRYGFLTQIKPVSPTETHYTAYFYDPIGDEWYLIATFERPLTHTYAKGWYQFIEVYLENNGNIERSGHYGNYWVRNTQGDWFQINSAMFTGTMNASFGYRNDFTVGLSSHDGMIYLTTGGFNIMPTQLNRVITLESLGDFPGIDLDALPKE